MANEIQLTTKLILANGYYSEKFDPGTINITQTTIGGYGAVVSVGSGAEEDLLFGDVATPTFVALRNLDTTNYVTYGPKSAGVMVLFGKIMPGHTAIFYLGASVTLRWIANTATCKVKVLVLEL